MCRRGLHLGIAGAAQMAIEVTDEGAAGGTVTAIVVVDGGGLGRIERIELDQRRTAIGVAFNIDHREVDFPVATDDLEVETAHREREARVVKAIPQDRMVARQRHAREHAVAHVGGIVVIHAARRMIGVGARPDAATPDHDLVGQRIERGKREHAAGIHGGVVATGVADESGSAELRLLWHERNRQRAQHAIDLDGIRSGRGDVAEEHRIGRGLGRDARSEGRSCIHFRTVTAQVVIQRRTSVDEPLGVGVEHRPIGIEPPERLSIAKAVARNIVQVVGDDAAIGVEIDRPRVGEDTTIEIGQRGHVGTHGHIPGRHQRCRYAWIGNVGGIGLIAAGCGREAHAVDARARRHVPAGSEAVGHGRSEIGAVGAGQLLRAIGDGAASCLRGAAEVRGCRDRLVATGTERLRVVDEDITAVAAVARAEQDDFARLRIHVQELALARDASIQTVAEIHHATVAGGPWARRRMKGARPFGQRRATRAQTQQDRQGGQGRQRACAAQHQAGWRRMCCRHSGCSARPAKSAAQYGGIPVQAAHDAPLPRHRRVGGIGWRYGGHVQTPE